jgi:hypothetical protein
MYGILKFSGRDIVSAAYMPAGEDKRHRREWTSTGSRDRSEGRRHRGDPRRQ